jgi:hypothetical protein
VLTQHLMREHCQSRHLIVVLDQRRPFGQPSSNG